MSCTELQRKDKTDSQNPMHSLTARSLPPSELTDTESPHIDTRPNKRSAVVPKWLRLGRSSKSPTNSIHRCMLVHEIFSLILLFIRDWDEYPPEELHFKWDPTVGKRSLAYLARTCRAFSESALDVLWMRLDSLDPLIKVFPRRMWAKKHYPFVVRMFMGEKQWKTFRKYAQRVKFLRGPCWRVSTSVQHNVISALARFPKTSLPLLPNLTELVWSELKMANFIDPSISLIKYFAGPGITRISLALICWPIHDSELSVLSELPKTCPNLTSFTTFFPRSSYNDRSREIGELVLSWLHLRHLKTCALPQPVMEDLLSNPCLESLDVELNNSNTALYVGTLPSQIRHVTLGANSASLCHRYLQTIQCSPTHFRLRIGADDSTLMDILTLFSLLPTQVDKHHLQSLIVDLTSSYWSTPPGDTFPLTPPLMTTLFAFSGLQELDLGLFCSSTLDDAEYGRIARALKALRSLKIGAGDVSKTTPVASVGAVIAVLRGCQALHTLHIAFDGTIPPPPFVPASDTGNARALWTRDEEDESKRARGSESEIEEERIELGIMTQRSPRRAPPGKGWGVSNHAITQIYVGYSPIEDTSAASLASCLKSVMPSLERIRCDKYPTEVALKWNRVETFLAGDD